jgi:predicted CoA-binding protein
MTANWLPVDRDTKRICRRKNAIVNVVCQNIEKIPIQGRVWYQVGIGKRKNARIAPRRLRRHSSHRMWLAMSGP